MPFKSKAQQRFMFSQHPEMAKEFADHTPDIKALPEHVKKMAEGGDVTSGNPANLDKGIQDATVSDGATLAALAGLAGAAPEILEAVPEMLGSEAGEVSLGAAPEMEGMPSKIQAFSKGVMGKGTPNEMTIWGVKGDPEEIAKLGYGNDPASIPEHILRQHGILPADVVNASSQEAPNSFAKGGEVKEKVNSMSDIGTLKGLRDLLMKHQNGEDFEVHGSTDMPKNYADGGDVDPVAMMTQTAAPSAMPVDVENGMTPPPTPNVDQDFINKLNQGMNLPPAPIPNPIMQTGQAAQGLPPTNPNIYQDISADDRAAMLQKLLAQKSSAGSLATKGIAGLGDAITSSFGKTPTNAMGNIREQENQNINTRIGAVDTQRQQRMQDLQANLAQQENDPTSPYSQGMRQFYSQLTGKTFPSGISASMMKSAFPDYAKIFDSQLTAATAQRGQTLGAQEKLATKSVWQRMADNIFGNPAGEKLSTETGVSASSDNGGWSVKR